jgi:putative transposase
VKLTLKIKLLPSVDQAGLLLQTIKEANRACNLISDIAWEKKAFQQFKLHHACYHPIKGATVLSSQVMIGCISMVADGYKLDKKVKRTFKPLGAICYDSRVLTYNPGNMVSIWAVGGRLKIPFVCHKPDYLPFIQGEADLAYRKGKFYLLQTVEPAAEEVKDAEECIGVDMGLVEIATLSNGKKFNSQKLTDYREKRQKIRSSLQSKCTKNAKRVLKRLSGRERTTATIINHTISKQIVSIARMEGKGVAIENLKGIRHSANKKGKKFRSRVGKWNFSQLRAFLAYKCLMNGVELAVVPPAYTSKTCHVCKHIGNRQGKEFTCTNCNVMFDSDVNAAKNIALLGMNVNHPEKPSMWYCTVQRA